MPAITATSIQSIGDKAVTETTLDGATDSLIYNKGAILTLRNPTAGSLTPVIDGDGAGSVSQKGLGNIDLSAGYTFSAIPVGDAAVIKLDDISEYLKGVIAINSGTGLIATLLEA